MLIPSRFRIFTVPKNNQSEEQQTTTTIKGKCIEYKVPETIDEESISIIDLYDVKPEIFNGSDEYDLKESQKYPLLFSIDTQNKFASETRNLKTICENYFNKKRETLNYLVFEIENLSSSTLSVIEIPDDTNLEHYREYKVSGSQKIVLEYSKEQLDYENGKYKNLKLIIKGDNFKYRFVMCFED
jgi:hypothetical protein